MSSFLDRFTGKTQAISKLGIDKLLIGKQNSHICTSSTIFNSPKHTRLIFNKINTDTNDYSPQQPSLLHLPPIQQRFLNAQRRKETEECRFQSNSRVYIDKETKWLIEVPQSTSQHINDKDDEKNKTKVQLQQEKDKKSLKNKQMERKQITSKGHRVYQSVKRLGGLGANIGGLQWQFRKQKHDKAMKYAVQLKCKHKQRIKLRDDCDSQISNFFING